MSSNYVKELHDHFLSGNGVFTDTRNPIPGGLFIALSGPNFDGNKFADDALANGASAVVVDNEQYQLDERYILVEDTLLALQELAKYHRSNFRGPVLAITGSNGKTTTKELIGTILRGKYDIIATEGNLNNHIGVPLTVLRIGDDTEFAVVEMGANHQGEIKVLCNIAQPTHGLITNIGKAHIEGFGSFEGIKQGKKELYDHLMNTGGTIFVNAADSILNEMVSDTDNIVYYAGESTDSQLIEALPFVKVKVGLGITIETHLIGEFNYTNIAAAISIGKYFGVPSSQVEASLADYIPDSNRSQVLTNGTNTIILDAYNANPDSVDVAIRTLDAMTASSKIVILGDMLELGKDAVSEHKLVGNKVKALNSARALFCGELSKYSAEQVPGSLHFESKDDLIDYLQQNSISDSVILIKASRGMSLESIVEVI